MRRELGCLFKLRRTKRARAMIDLLEASDATGWKNAGQGWGGAPRPNWLWRAGRGGAKRRRARQSREPLPLLDLMGVPATTVEVLDYEFQILVASLPYGVAALYWDRGDTENSFGELKNQWVGRASPHANCASTRSAPGSSGWSTTGGASKRA